MFTVRRRGEVSGAAAGTRRCRRMLAPVMVSLVLLLGAGTARAANDGISASAVALFKNMAVIVINGERRKLKVGETSPEGVRLVKSSSEAAVIAIGEEEMTLRLDGRIVSHYTRGIAAGALQLYPDRSGHYAVDGMINGHRMRFLVDTGATSVSINKAAAKRIGLLYTVDGAPTMVETAAGVVAAYRVRFDEVQVRNLTVRRVEGLVVDGDFPRIALLGQSFLNRLDMRREGQMLELRER